MAFDETVNSVSKTCAADGDWTDPIFVQGGQEFALQLTGTAGSTVTVQRSYSKSAPNWVDVNSYAVFQVYADTEPVGAWFRAGLKTGGFATNSVVARLDRGHF